MWREATFLLPHRAGTNNCTYSKQHINTFRRIRIRAAMKQLLHEYQYLLHVVYSIFTN